MFFFGQLGVGGFGGINPLTHYMSNPEQHHWSYYEWKIKSLMFFLVNKKKPYVKHIYSDMGLVFDPKNYWPHI